MNKLSPENLLVPSQKNVRAILACYNLPLTRFLHATHGIENLTLLIWSRRKKYVLRVYPQKKKSDADILLELDFMSHLRNYGLPIPAIISSSDNRPLVICEYDNKKWQSVLMEHAIGAHPETWTPVLLDHMALLQARMHTLDEQYAKRHPMKSGRTALRETDVADELLKNTTLESDGRDFLERVKAFIVELDNSLPKGLSHFDPESQGCAFLPGIFPTVCRFCPWECGPANGAPGKHLYDDHFLHF